MTSTPAQRSLRHTALEEPCGEVRSFARARLNDSQRLGVLLQVAAIDSLCPQAESGRAQGSPPLADLGVDESGVVRTRVLRGTDPSATQQRLTRVIAELFASGERIEGRGAARRAVRLLQKRWRQSLVDIPPDRLVADVLDAAPFLWASRHALARGALVLGEGDHVRLAGPGPLRAWIAEGCRSYDETVARLESLRSSLAPVAAETETRARAAAALFAGRHAECERLLRGRWQEAPDLAFLSAVELGRLHTARRRLPAALGSSMPGSAEFWSVCRGALRLYANLGQPALLRQWVARALWQERRARRGDGRVVAAQGYWDLGRLEAMARHLEACSSTKVDDVAELEQTRSLLHLSGGQGECAARALSRALKADRRRLSNARAGRLWNDLVSARALCGDLAGAERAARHAFRLLSVGEGPAAQTLALHNLAEVRLRRGMSRGFESLLHTVEEENRESRNLRASFYDLEMRVRWLIFRGSFHEAVGLLEGGLAKLEELDETFNRDSLRSLASRCWGWLEEPERAAAALPRLLPAGCFEAEELPALYALAGASDRAEEVCQGPSANLWRRALRGLDPTPSDWGRLAVLEPFRRARLVLDLTLCGVAVAAERRQWAVRQLRRCGGAAELLSRSGQSSLVALADFEGARPEHDELRRLFRDAGCSGVEISFLPSRRVDREVVVAGCGGEERCQVEAADGTWTVEAETLTERGTDLFRLLVRGLPALSVPRRREPRSQGEMLGRAPQLLEVLRRARLLAAETMPILIQGESGTGKELLARLCHRASGRREGPFQAVNCAALTESLALGELFGHVRGAFTGAERDRRGVFEEASGGTVFLDEIGDLHPRAQGMLLRVLQEGEIQRLGENQVRKVDSRVVAATHRNLEDLVADGGFRQDLYFRLRVGSLLLPPLRERGADVELLAEAFAAEKGLLLSEAAARRLSARSWPGNVRELKATVEAASAIVVGEGRPAIDAEDLGLDEESTERRLGYHEWLQLQRRRKVTEALEASAGNQSAAARALGLSRQAMSYLVRELGVRAP